MPQADEWAGMPEGHVYCWVWGKAPKYDKWNAPKNLFSLKQIKEAEYPSWHTQSYPPSGYGMVSGRWSGTLAVDFDTNPDDPEQSELTFHITTGHPSADLPPSATVISGRPGRRRIFYKVPEDWWGALSGWSAKLQDLELRWEGGDHNAPVPIQSVMHGPHPGHPDWHFRWADGLSPSEVGFQEAPVWLLIGMVKQRGAEVAAETEEKIYGPHDPDQPKYCDQLNPARTRKLLRMFSDYWPYRGGQTGTRYQASWDADSFSGLLGALNNELGPQMAREWLSQTKWFNNNEDWGCSTDFETALKSVGKSKTGKKAGWGTLHYLATRTEDKAGRKFEEPPLQLPPWALPPKQVEVSDLASQTVKQVKAFKSAMHQIDLMETPLDRLTAFQNLAKSLEVTEIQLKNMLLHLMEEESGQTDGRWNGMVAGAPETEVAIEKLLAFNCLTILGAEGGAGKSTLLYRMMEAAANGSNFMGQLRTARGNVLLIQKDESVANMAAKARLMEMSIPDDAVEVKTKFNAGMFPDLRRWIVEHQARYVLMDSMISLFGQGSDLNECQVGTYMYVLNTIASELNCAIVLTHHLRKQHVSRKREDIQLGDLYGSAFIGAGTSDVLGLIRDPEKKDEDDPHYLLKVLKPRSGVSEQGDVFRVQGDRADLSWTLNSMNGDERGVAELRKREKSLLDYLKNRTEETAVNKVEIASALGVTQRTVERLMKDMYGNKRLGIKRKKEESYVGRPSYRYWV